MHLVHNNAGVGGGGPIWQVPEQDWRWILGVNLWGVIHGVAAFVPLFIEQGEGHVVNTASIAGLTTAPFLGPYNATKQAVVAISETLVQGPTGGRRHGRGRLGPLSRVRADTDRRVRPQSPRLGPRTRCRRRERNPAHRDQDMIASGIAPEPWPSG